MVDFAMDVFSSLYPDKEVPKELKDKRAAVVSELKSLQSAVVPITMILEDQNVTEQIQNSRDGRQLFETLSKDHKFKPEYLDVLYDFAKFCTSAAITPAPPNTSISTEYWPPRRTKTS